MTWKMSGGIERILESLTPNWKQELLELKRDSCDPVILSYNGHGCRFRKFRHHETVAGDRDHHGCKHWNDSYLMAFESLTGSRVPDFRLNTLKSVFCSSPTDRYYYVYVRQGQKRKIFPEILLGFAILMFGMETMSDAEVACGCARVYRYSIIAQ